MYDIRPCRYGFYFGAKMVHFTNAMKFNSFAFHNLQPQKNVCALVDQIDNDR